ncbi:MAG: hypothetical protein V1659_02640 [Candidatus Woesearchaeota archaeon]
MSKTMFGIVLLVLLLSIINAVSAVDFTGPSSNDRKIVFEPGLVKSFTFSIGGAAHLKTFLTGDLLEYVTLEDPDPDGGARDITATIRLPDSLPAGNYKFAVGAGESAGPSGATVGGVTAIQAAIWVYVYREDKYLEYVFGPEDANINSTGKLRFDVNSFSKQNLDSVRGFASIYDTSDRLIMNVTTDVFSLSSGERKTIYVPYSTQTGFVPSQYKAKGFVVYDGITTNTQESMFKIGDLGLDIISCTETLYAGEINKFFITVQNTWNGILENVYAKITINGKEFSTPFISLYNFETKSLEGYWDAVNLEPGEFDANVNVFFADGKVKTKTCKLTLTERPISGPEEKPKKPLSLAMIVIIVLVVLLLFNIIFFFFASKRKKSKQTAGQPPADSHSGDRLVSESVVENKVVVDAAEKKVMQNTDAQDGLVSESVVENKAVVDAAEKKVTEKDTAELKKSRKQQKK